MNETLSSAIAKLKKKKNRLFHVIWKNPECRLVDSIIAPSKNDRDETSLYLIKAQ